MSAALTDSLCLRATTLSRNDARRNQLTASSANSSTLTLCLRTALDLSRHAAANATGGLQGRQLRNLHLLTLHLDEFLFELLDYAEILLLLLTRDQDILLELLNLLFLARQLTFSNLQVNLKNTLLTCRVLVHLMNVVQVLLKVLRLLFIFEVIFRDRVLQLLVSILHFVQLHLELEDLFNAVQQILV